LNFLAEWQIFVRLEFKGFCGAIDAKPPQISMQKSMTAIWKRDFGIVEECR